jgi:hypothetical protein
LQHHRLSSLELSIGPVSQRECERLQADNIHRGMLLESSPSNLLSISVCRRFTISTKACNKLEHQTCGSGSGCLGPGLGPSPGVWVRVWVWVRVCGSISGSGSGLCTRDKPRVRAERLRAAAVRIHRYNSSTCNHVTCKRVGAQYNMHKIYTNYSYRIYYVL